MSPQRYNHIERTRPGKAYIMMVLLLCLFVVVQMLGVPVTLLNPIEPADSLTSSVFEGFSIPSSIPRPTAAFNGDPVTEGPPSRHMPVLTSALFRPPVL